MDLIPHVIVGEDVESAGAARFPTVDLWTQQAHADVARGGG